MRATAPWNLAGNQHPYKLVFREQLETTRLPRCTPCGQNQDCAFSAPSLLQDYSGTSTASSATFRYTVSGSPIKALGDAFRENNDSVGSSTMSAVIQSKPEKDSRVEAAISHWAPRFVANGVPLVDFQEVTAGISRWEDWCD